MAIRFRLANDNVRAVRFAVSPLAEAVMSLNALIFPRERGLQHGWIRAMRDLPAALRRELTAFSWVLDYAVPDCIVPTPGRRTAATWEDELARVAALSPLEAGYELARPSFHYALHVPQGPGALERDDVRAFVEGRARRYGPAALGTARLAWEDPTGSYAGSSPFSTGTGSGPSRRNGADSGRNSNPSRGGTPERLSAAASTRCSTAGSPTRWSIPTQAGSSAARRTSTRCARRAAGR
jgi:hypothetical protein